MIEVHDQGVPSSQPVVDDHGLQHDQMDLDAMTDLELRSAFHQLSLQIEERKAQKVNACLSWMDQVEWEAAICCAMYLREAIQLTLIYRDLEKLRPAVQTYTH